MTVELFVANLFGINKDDLFTQSRRREISNARQICMYMRREFAGHSLNVIARYFGKDHCSVIHSMKATKNYYATEPHYREIVDQVISAWDDHSINMPAEHFNEPIEVNTPEEQYIIQLT